MLYQTSHRRCCCLRCTTTRRRAWSPSPRFTSWSMWAKWLGFVQNPSAEAKEQQQTPSTTAPVAAVQVARSEDAPPAGPWRGMVPVGNPEQTTSHTTRIDIVDQPGADPFWSWNPHPRFSMKAQTFIIREQGDLGVLDRRGEGRWVSSWRVGSWYLQPTPGSRKLQPPLRECGFP